MDADIEQLKRDMHRFGTAMQAALDSIMPDVRRIVHRLHAALFPERHKRLMLREARQRARLSTQRKRKS